ncbi:MAG TPA: hypothetical protein V6C86_20285 [Oculatellaceae cyanobacterium]
MSNNQNDFNNTNAWSPNQADQNQINTAFKGLIDAENQMSSADAQLLKDTGTNNMTVRVSLLKPNPDNLADKSCERKTATD